MRWLVSLWVQRKPEQMIWTDLCSTRRNPCDVNPNVFPVNVLARPESIPVSYHTSHAKVYWSCSFPLISFLLPPLLLLKYGQATSHLQGEIHPVLRHGHSHGRTDPALLKHQSWEEMPPPLKVPEDLREWAWSRCPACGQLHRDGMSQTHRQQDTLYFHCKMIPPAHETCCPVGCLPFQMVSFRCQEDRFDRYWKKTCEDGKYIIK